MIQIAGRPGLPGKDIAAVALVLQDSKHCIRSPFRIARLRAPPQLHQRLRDLLAAISVEVHKEAEPDGQRFLLIDGQLAIFADIVAQQRGRQEDTHRETHVHRTVHRAALRVRFLLCQRGHERQAHLTIAVQRVDVLSFKEHAHRVRQRSQVTDFTNAVQHVARESADALRDNQVDLAGFTVLDHLFEFITMAERCAADPFVYLNAVFDTNGKAFSGAQSAGKGLISWAFAVLPVYPTGLRKPCFSFQ